MSAPAAADNNPRVIKAWRDITVEEERRMFDDYIRKLSVKGRLNLTIDEINRKAFWDHVFEEGWNSSMPVPGVGREAPKRKQAESSLRIGILSEDAPNSSPGGKKRTHDGSVRVMPGRHAGQPVYLRPSLRLGTNDLGVEFDYVDGSGRNIPTNLLRLDDGVLMENAMAQAIMKFEKYESKRVNEWNLSLFVMWARKRLQLYLKPNHEDEDTTMAARLRHAIGAVEDEEHGKLEKLVSAVDRFKEFQKIVAKVELGDVRAWRF